MSTSSPTVTLGLTLAWLWPASATAKPMEKQANEAIAANTIATRFIPIPPREKSATPMDYTLHPGTGFGIACNGLERSRLGRASRRGRCVRCQGEIQLLVREHGPPRQDLRHVVFEEDMGQVVQPDLDLLPNAHHLDQVGARPQEPCELARHGDAEQLEHRGVLPEGDDVAGVTERERLGGVALGTLHELLSDVAAHRDAGL